MMLLEMASQAFGEREAFHCQGDSLTYLQLFAAAGKAAQMIRESGCEYVSILDETGLATPVALFGSAWAGVPYAPLNYRLTQHEISVLQKRLEPVFLITGEDRESASPPQGQVISSGEFLNEARRATGQAQAWSMDPHAVAVSLFTSGTTGEPKAAILRQKHLVSYILGSGEFMSAGEEEATLSCVPPYHIAGIASLISSVYAGRRVVQLPAFTAHDWLATCAQQRVTSAFLVPTMLTRIVEAVEGGASVELPSLRAISYGGGKMPQSVIERAMRYFSSVDFTNAYGLTETSSTITLLTPEAHRQAYGSDKAEVRRRLTSVGRALPGVDIEVRDGKGRVLGPELRGEIYVRGEQVSGEYADKGSVVDEDGWFPTRDAGWMDEEGFLFLEGRADDVIVRGGENLSPGEIEDVLLEHPAIRDVAVVGIPDDQWGESVAAAVVLKQGQAARSEDLQDWVKKHMRSSRVPQTVIFREELPYNETGKLLRRQVKADFLKCL